MAIVAGSIKVKLCVRLFFFYKWQTEIGALSSAQADSIGGGLIVIDLSQSIDNILNLLYYREVFLSVFFMLVV